MGFLVLVTRELSSLIAFDEAKNHDSRREERTFDILVKQRAQTNRKQILEVNRSASIWFNSVPFGFE